MNGVISAWSARAVLRASLNALPFMTGKVPGRPSETGSVWVFGGRPNSVPHAENILLSVESWTWTSQADDNRESMPPALESLRGREENSEYQRKAVGGSSRVPVGRLLENARGSQKVFPANAGASNWRPIGRPEAVEPQGCSNRGSRPWRDGKGRP